MTALKISTEVLPNGHQGNGEWLQITPGERFKIRTSVEETEGVYTMLELVAEPRNVVQPKTKPSPPHSRVLASEPDAGWRDLS
jgi:hypothetical protein